MIKLSVDGAGGPQRPTLQCSAQRDFSLSEDRQRLMADFWELNNQRQKLKQALTAHTCILNPSTRRQHCNGCQQKTPEPGHLTTAAIETEFARLGSALEEIQSQLRQLG